MLAALPLEVVTRPLPLLIVAYCRTLPDFLTLNARYDEQASVVMGSGCVHLGMATQTDSRLTVRVISDAQARMYGSSRPDYALGMDGPRQES